MFLCPPIGLVHRFGVRVYKCHTYTGWRVVARAACPRQARVVVQAYASSGVSMAGVSTDAMITHDDYNVSISKLKIC